MKFDNSGKNAQLINFAFSIEGYQSLSRGKILKLKANFRTFALSLKICPFSYSDRVTLYIGFKFCVALF